MVDDLTTAHSREEAHAAGSAAQSPHDHPITAFVSPGVAYAPVTAVSICRRSRAAPWRATLRPWTACSPTSTRSCRRIAAPANSRTPSAFLGHSRAYIRRMIDHAAVATDKLRVVLEAVSEQEETELDASWCGDSTSWTETQEGRAR